MQCLPMILINGFSQVMLLDQGRCVLLKSENHPTSHSTFYVARIAEFDKPGVLLRNPNTKFHALCKATGKEEFAMLKKMAGV